MKHMQNSYVSIWDLWKARGGGGGVSWCALLILSEKLLWPLAYFVPTMYPPSKFPNCAELIKLFHRWCTINWKWQFSRLTVIMLSSSLLLFMLYWSTWENCCQTSAHTWWLRYMVYLGHRRRNQDLNQTMIKQLIHITPLLNFHYSFQDAVLMFRVYLFSKCRIWDAIKWLNQQIITIKV